MPPACLLSVLETHSLTAVTGELDELLTAWTSNTHNREFFWLPTCSEIKLENVDENTGLS